MTYDYYTNIKHSIREFIRKQYIERLAGVQGAVFK